MMNCRCVVHEIDSETRTNVTVIRLKWKTHEILAIGCFPDSVFYL